MNRSATATSKGQVVIPADIRRKHGITRGTRIFFTEDEKGRIVLQPVTKAYIHSLAGCLAGSGITEHWMKEHRREGRRRG